MEDCRNFKIDEGVTVVGVENFENFKQMEKQLYLFNQSAYLFIFSYHNDAYLEWLSGITNPYLHFGDFDLTGLLIIYRKIKNKLSTKLIPFLGMASAFTFLIMMFNIPIPGGSSGHAVGAALIAIILGPWVAFISISVALILQAIIFGDGGITTLGANCFNMAIIMPFVAYLIFRVINWKSDNTLRMTIAAFFAGYLSLVTASIVTAVELGIQPLIAVSPQGQPLYSPYPLNIALPVMALENIFVFGIVEGIITAILFKYFYKNNRDLIKGLKY